MAPHVSLEDEWYCQTSAVIPSHLHRDSCVLQEYFRGVTRQDVLNLLSFCSDPQDDDALLVPQIGRPAEDAQQPQPPLHPPSATAAKAAKAFAYSATASVAGDEGDDGQEVGVLSWGQ